MKYIRTIFILFLFILVNCSDTASNNSNDAGYDLSQDSNQQDSNENDTQDQGKSWIKTIGGQYQEQSSIILEAEDGIIAAGVTKSYGWGDFDIWIVKLDLDGNVVWQESIGSQKSEIIQLGTKTSNGNYVFVGTTNILGDKDILLININENGELVWKKIIGSNANEEGYGIAESDDSLFIVGVTDNGDFGSMDSVIIKLDQNGEILWQKIFGRQYSDYSLAVTSNDEQGVTIVGVSESLSSRDWDISIYSLNGSGEILWQKTIGGTACDYGYAITKTGQDYIISGYSESFGEGGKNVFIAKFENDGQLKWQKVFGESLADEGFSVHNFSTGFLISGYSENSEGMRDIFIMNFDEDGQLKWQKNIGDTQNDEGFSIRAFSNGSIVMTGYSTVGNNGEDFIIAKLNSNGDIPIYCTNYNEIEFTPRQADGFVNNMEASINDLYLTISDAEITTNPSSAVINTVCSD